jgi:excisionase family DNA binding protein
MAALLSTREAAQRLGCSEAAIRKWTYQRRLAVVRLGRLVRFRLEDIEKISSQGL